MQVRTCRVEEHVQSNNSLFTQVCGLEGKWAEMVKILEKILGFFTTPPSTSAQPHEIVLIMGPQWGVNMPFAGFGFISAYLESQGLSHSIFDMNIRMFNDVSGEDKHLWDFENHEHWVDQKACLGIFKKFNDHIHRYVDEILALNCRNLGFSVNAGNRIMTVEILKLIRERAPGTSIILGGPACFRNEERQLIPEDLVDYFVVGEGESVLYELLMALRTGAKAVSIPGVVDTKRAIDFAASEPIHDLGRMPSPTYAGFELSDYTEKIMPLLMSRGCKARCAFCDSWVLSPQYRSRDAESVVEEITHHVNVNGIKAFAFNDLAINWDLDNLERFCDLLIGSRLEIAWYGSATVRKNMTQRLFDKIKLSGNSREGAENIYGFEGGFLTFGVESGSRRVLKQMGKGYDPPTASRILAMSKGAGIRTLINIIVGFPGETEEDFQETVEFVVSNKHNFDHVSNLLACFIPRNTRLFTNPERFGVIPETACQQYNWRGEAGNNSSVRKQRMEKMTEVLETNGIQLLQGGTTDGDEREEREVMS